MIEPGEAIVALASLGLIGVVVYPLARAVARKIEGESARKAALPDDTAQRMARMEAAIESVAIEVERISEGQRFVTKLLAEQRDDRRLPPGGAS
ncbi:MAG: hypothetical protein ACYC3L_00120 [Gemmatimonadaceae bacterium]